MTMKQGFLILTNMIKINMEIKSRKMLFLKFNFKCKFWQFSLTPYTNLHQIF
jgi:hypothetical protein